MHYGSPTESHLRIPVLQFLSKQGGMAWLEEVYAHIYAEFSGRWTEEDYKVIKNGELRWRNRVRQAIRPLVRDGYMYSPVPKALWEISPKGEHYLKMIATD